MNCYNFSINANGGQCVVDFGSCENNTAQNNSCVNKFVTDFNNIISYPNITVIETFPKYAFTEGVRQIWEDWDLPVLVLYTLFIQLYLHVFGRGRRKDTTQRSVINFNVWLLYLLADLVATIALGKLSNVEKDVNRYVEPRSVVRSMWAPIILFYLGGPDTITVLTLEENQMWLRHLVGLLIQGLRTSYVLYVTWSSSWLSVLALWMLIPGIIKYSEKVWVIKSRVWATGDDNTTSNLDQVKNINTSLYSPNELVVEAYSYFQTLKPHIPSYGCDRTRLDKLVEKFQKWARSISSCDDSNVNVFKLIEIELGFMHDVFYTKIGLIFTVRGCILRFISVSCIVCALVGYFWFRKPQLLLNDHSITIILLLGAILLEIGGVLVQLGSDWAVVWAFKLPTALSMVSTLILGLHKRVIRKSRKRWVGLMGQFSFLDYCSKTMPNEMMSSIRSSVRTLKMKFSSPSSHVTDDVKKLIIDQLCKRSDEVGTLQTFSTITRGEWALQQCEAQALEWSVKFEFAESLIIWHIATEVCYHLEEAKPELMEPTRMLSNYMMHLLLICTSTFPICDINVDLLKVRDDMKKILEGKGSVLNVKLCELLLDEESTSSNATLSRAKALACNLKARIDRWTVMSKVWVEMLCYAASRISLKYHALELRHGVEFITHVWLLLQHFGVKRNLIENRPGVGASDLAINALQHLPSAVGAF